MFHLLSFAGNCVFWFGAVLPISFLYACPSSSQTPYRSLSVQARKVRSFRCSSSPQKVSRLFGDPLVRGVAVLALSRSSHSHICLGNGYAVVQVHILIMRGMREGHFRVLLKNSFSMSLADFSPSSGRSRERLKIKSLEKIFIPSLGRQRKRRKINPPRKIFCFGSKSEPFSCAGLLVAPKWSRFFVYGIKSDPMSIPDVISVAAKLMP